MKYADVELDKAWTLPIVLIIAAILILAMSDDTHTRTPNDVLEEWTDDLKEKQSLAGWNEVESGFTWSLHKRAVPGGHLYVYSGGDKLGMTFVPHPSPEK